MEHKTNVLVCLSRYNTEVADISILFIMLLLLNCGTEYLFNKMMLVMGVLEKKFSAYHSLCSAARVAWICLSAWFACPMPVLLIGLFVLLYMNMVPYHSRTLQMHNFTLSIYLIYISLLMTVIGGAGILGFDVQYLLQDAMARVIILNATFFAFNSICLVVLRCYPDFLWKENYDRAKVIIYTRFLFICIIYHVVDSVILTLYETGRIGYLLLISGDGLILVLIYNFLRYNYVFEKSEDMRKEYEKSEILMAQKYFEKETLKKISEIDVLTNTYNRREISSIMADAIQEGHKLTCVFIDLDGLKQANDKYGHTYGDLMLKKFADACSKAVEGNGYLARVGGDEFLLVFLGQEISMVEERVRTLQLKLLEPEDEKEKIYFSYGISYDEESVDKYISVADQEMYACKTRKRCGSI